MISIEAHRTAIGRFHGKSRYHSRAIPCKSGCIDLMYFMIILMLLQLLIYGALVMTLFFLFNYIMALFMLTLSYGYSYLIIRHGTGLLCDMMKTLSFSLGTVLKGSTALEQTPRMSSLRPLARPKSEFQGHDQVGY